MFNSNLHSKFDRQADKKHFNLSSLKQSETPIEWFQLNICSEGLILLKKKIDLIRDFFCEMSLQTSQHRKMCHHMLFYFFRVIKNVVFLTMTSTSILGKQLANSGDKTNFPKMFYT